MAAKGYPIGSWLIPSKVLPLSSSARPAGDCRCDVAGSSLYGACVGAAQFMETRPPYTINTIHKYAGPQSGASPSPVRAKGLDLDTYPAPAHSGPEEFQIDFD